ncbi:DUF5337 family protein [Jannaschia sp. M317]|uniref:DUF5337 family protein n=1 Tax=Jannaschia sp. M317 TaxID=2867011 RepID=UPI0021A777C9|nr:DUF5337 family protein [Jannaschia sp. M317]UWQ17813.1 DUF5337 family protein [Jannaschia sp. M317]
MTGPSSSDRRIAKAQRNVALVILGTFAVWLPLQGLGVWLNLPTRLMGLADLVALAALGFALIMLLRVRKMRREEE